jgi:hypothetical protein
MRATLLSIRRVIVGEIPGLLGSHSRSSALIDIAMIRLLLLRLARF